MNLPCSAREFQLLILLAKNNGAVLDKFAIEQGLSNFEEDRSENYIPSLMARLRTKITVDDESQLIHTVRGQGYRLALSATPNE